ncbi:MAG: RNA polymerase sigma factor [Ruminococcus sp.]|nr:RNA polymerase sigma factor [Ruminococcus sp.]
MVTNNQSFNEIYEKYKNLVLKTAYKYSGDYSLADDIMQETFFALYKDMQKKNYQYAEQYKNLKAWLITTAKNATINQVKKRANEVSIFEAEEDLLGESPEEQMIEETGKRENARLHRRIMADLYEKNPRWYRAIFLACYLKIKQEEAAEIMGMNKGAFHLLLHRARGWIRKKYSVEYEELMRY